MPRGEVGTTAVGPQGYKAKKAQLQGLGKLAFRAQADVCDINQHFRLASEKCAWAEEVVRPGLDLVRTAEQRRVRCKENNYGKNYGMRARTGVCGNQQSLVERYGRETAGSSDQR